MLIAMKTTILLSADSLRNKHGLIGSNLQNHHGKMELTLDGMRLSQEKKSSVTKNLTINRFLWWIRRRHH